MNIFDYTMRRHYMKIKKEIIPEKGECPKENLFWDYVREEIKEEEREKMDGHLLVCPDCLESLKAIRMIHQAENSTQKLPAHLHSRAKDILQKELEKSRGQPESKPMIMKIALLWDQVRHRITQVNSYLGDKLITPSLEFQPVRGSRKMAPEAEENQVSLPWQVSREIDQGNIYLEIDRSDKEGYLLLKVSLKLRPGETTDKMEKDKLRAILYKSNRICSTVYLDPTGVAIFNRLKEGEYSLELSVKEKSLGMIELSLSKAAR